MRNRILRVRETLFLPDWKKKVFITDDDDIYLELKGGEYVHKNDTESNLLLQHLKPLFDDVEDYLSVKCNS